MLFTGQFNRALSFSLIALILLASGCGSTARAPLTSVELIIGAKPSPETTYTGRTTIVRPGDNLYSISFLAGENYLDVAAWNNMDPEETIYPGQVIKLYPKEGTTSIPSKRPAATSSADVPIEQSADENNQQIIVGSTQVSSSGWIWPAQGKLVATYSQSQRRNGIQIAGENGAPIRVSANGRVVYSGTGLIGYGRIIIVKHSERLLSVYAHNSRVVVKEGDTVSQGQKIAEMGSTDTNRVKLHFEIRQDGKPVDPLRFLPKA